MSQLYFYLRKQGMVRFGAAVLWLHMYFFVSLIFEILNNYGGGLNIDVDSFPHSDTIKKSQGSEPL